MSNEKYTGPRVKDNKTFIQKARWVHGHRYDYSKVEYETQKQKVEIICKEHGSFWQNPTKHTSRGDGCPRCSGHGIGTQEVLKRFFDTHGETYSYANFIYRGRFIKSVVTCRIHGDFMITPSDHYRGNGCRVCGNMKKGQYRKVNSSTWLSRCISKHGNKYDYSKTKFKTTEDIIDVGCPSHGTFQIPLGKHVYRGDGCPKCSNKGLSNEEWIKKFSCVHRNKYCYNKTEFKKSNVNVVITCPKHGDFTQTPNSHMSGSGCPTCANERRSDMWNPTCAYGLIGYYGTKNPANLYVLELGESFIRVGLAKNTSERIRRIERESGYSVEKIHHIQGPAIELWNLEQKILRESNLERFYPRLSFNGKSECLKLSELPKVLEIIQEWVDNQAEDCYS